MPSYVKNNPYKPGTKAYDNYNKRPVYKDQVVKTAPPLPTREQYDKAVNGRATSMAAFNSQMPANMANDLNVWLANNQGTPTVPQDAPQEEEDPFLAFLASLGEGDGEGGGGGGSGYNLGGVLSQIAEAYQTRLTELDRQRGEGEGIINDSSAKAQADIKARQADNTTQQDALNARIQQQYADALARRQAENQTLTAELSKFGVDPNRLLPGTMGGNAAMDQMRSAQSDLQTRMGQIANDSMSARAATSDLIAQGARGQLANGYAAVKMQMDLQRQQQEAEARQQAAAAAASRGGGKATDPLDRAMKILSLQEKFDKVNGGGGETEEYDFSMLQPGTGAYAAAVNGGKVDDVLRRYYTSSMNINGEDTEVFDDINYNKSYEQLRAARVSPNKALKKTTFKSR